MFGNIRWHFARCQFFARGEHCPGFISLPELPIGQRQHTIGMRMRILTGTGNGFLGPFGSLGKMSQPIFGKPLQVAKNGMAPSSRAPSVTAVSAKRPIAVKSTSEEGRKRQDLAT